MLLITLRQTSCIYLSPTHLPYWLIVTVLLILLGITSYQEQTIMNQEVPSMSSSDKVAPLKVALIGYGW